MSHKEDLALMAHLMRRAGFGASNEELERRVAQGYEATVEELVAPSEAQPGGDILCSDITQAFYYPVGHRFPVRLTGCTRWLAQKGLWKKK